MKVSKNFHAKAKQPIKIRFKALANGNSSIYLDIYQNGKRQYEFLKLYLIPEFTTADKKANQKTMQLAQTIQAQRILQMNTSAHGLSNQRTHSKILLRDYIEYYAGTKTGTTKQTFITLSYHLQRYDPSDTQIGKVDKSYILGFIEYLKGASIERTERNKGKILSKSSQSHYFKCLKMALDEAVIDDIIPSDPILKIKKSERPETGQGTKREYLTSEELQRFAETKHPNELLKRAFMIGCLTGLRHSDIKKMTWANVGVKIKGVECISITQTKTDEPVNIPLNHNILKWLPHKGNAKDNDLVFNGLITLGRSNEILPKWAEMAGIHKHLTFHISRHTFAVTAIQNNIDIYTVSKLLGHQSITVTQVYTEVLDSTKQAAMNKLDNLNV